MAGSAAELMRLLTREIPKRLAVMRVEADRRVGKHSPYLPTAWPWPRVAQEVSLRASEEGREATQQRPPLEQQRQQVGREVQESRVDMEEVHTQPATGGRWLSVELVPRGTEEETAGVRSHTPFPAYRSPLVDPADSG